MIEYMRLGPAEARSRVGELRAVYEAVFSLPPYNEGPEMAQAFVGWIRDESTLPGFCLVAASDSARLVGFAYGHRKPAGTWWRGADRPAPDAVRAADTFAVMEWAVLPDQRGQGIGRGLLDRLLADRPEPYATLMVNPSTDARAIYAQWGWHHVASTAPGRLPGMHILLRELSPHSS